jgi:uncharacterized protein (DUF2141 family)
MTTGKWISILTAAAVVAAIDLASAQQPSPNPPLRPRRDRPAKAAATGTAQLAGRVIAADTGRPLKRARVSVQSFSIGVQGLVERVTKTAVTDDNGRFSIPNLPEGKYSVSATKTGYVTMSAGQRRPLRPGTEIELGVGQAITNLDLRLPRGGVITGRIRDEDGEPLARAMVRVMRFQYLPGGRQLVRVQSDQTDDRGEYRVFGLPPGEYVVTAVAGAFERFGRTGASDFPEPDEELNYAPTYYPGVTSVFEAARVTVGAGQEHAGVDFSLLLVPTARVRGVIAGSSADTGERATVMLIPEEAGDARRAASYRARPATDSTFTIEMVPPGRYLAVAMAGAPAGRLYAMQSVVVSGDDIDGLALTLAPGGTIGGVIRFEGVGGPMAAEMSKVRIGLGPVEPMFTGRGTTLTESDGTFRVSDVPPGRQVLRISPPKGWTVRSATLDGRDITEEILDVKAGQTITGIEVLLSDRGAQIGGAVKADGDAVGSTVVIFPADSDQWVPQSRRIRVAQVDREGRYSIDGLPAGDYLIAAIEDVEPGEWFDPTFLQAIAEGAARIALDEGTRATKDLKLTPIP